MLLNQTPHRGAVAEGAIGEIVGQVRKYLCPPKTATGFEQGLGKRGNGGGHDGQMAAAGCRKVRRELRRSGADGGEYGRKGYSHSAFTRVMIFWIRGSLFFGHTPTRGAP